MNKGGPPAGSDATHLPTTRNENRMFSLLKPNPEARRKHRKQHCLLRHLPPHLMQDIGLESWPEMSCQASNFLVISDVPQKGCDPCLKMC